MFFYRVDFKLVLNLKSSDAWDILIPNKDVSMGTLLTTKMMNTYRSCSHTKRLQFAVILALLLVLIEPAHALRMTKMPEEMQTKTKEPVARRLTLKLPLTQPVFHWTFNSRRDFLAGKLVLHILRDGQSTSITIFEDGEFHKDWEAMEMPAPDSGEIYFGFQSKKKYLTALKDRLKIELTVTKDLDGIGAVQTGILPKGNYTSEGVYSGLLDEYKVPKEWESLPEESLEQLRQNVEFRAFMEHWEQQWELEITSEEGWLPEDYRKTFEKSLKILQEEDAKQEGVVK